MLINNEEKYNNHVKFISYTGEYPCLCFGILTLEIDGEEYKFNDYKDKSKNSFHNTFWISGGGCRFDEESIDEGEWIIDVEEIPEQFRKYSKEIEKVFNENVQYGCCGGCI